VSPLVLLVKFGGRQGKLAEVKTVSFRLNFDINIEKEPPRQGFNKNELKYFTHRFVN
jgi:hypothetical protein